MKWRTQKLSLVQQLMGLRRIFPNAKAEIQRSELVWQGELTPTPLSEVYQVEVRYKLERSPVVRVLHPVLETREGKAIPHLFGDGSLCLYFSKAREWNGSMPLSDTILPWTTEWLAHYEIWLVTGDWCGGGIH